MDVMTDRARSFGQMGWTNDYYSEEINGMLA